MLFYQKNGTRHKAKCTNKPKYLSMGHEHQTFIKKINEETCLFYQRKDQEIIHFCFRNEWFKAHHKIFENAEELYDADFLLKVQFV